MRRFTLLFVFVLLMGAGASVRGQSFFTTSDEVIVMDVPDGWTVIESGTETIIALSADGAQVIITYGQTLNAKIHTADVSNFIPETELGGLSLIDELTYAAFMLAEAEGIAPFVTVENVRGRDVVRYVNVTDSYDDMYYLTYTEQTGIVQFAVYGSTYPLVDMLELLYAFAPTPPATLDCGSVEIMADSAQPGAIIDVLNVPVGLEGFYVQAVAPDFEIAAPVIVIATESGAIMVSPPYPDLRLEGGTVALEIVYDGVVCQQMPFEVEAIPPAPGELQRFIEAAQDYINVTADFLGISIAELYDGTAPESMLPLAEVQFLISHPLNDESLDTLITTLEPDELEVIEALLAHDGYVPMLQARADYIRQQNALPPPPAQAATFQMVAYTGQTLPEQGFLPDPRDVFNRIEIPDGATLSEYMRLQDRVTDVQTFTEEPLDRIGLGNSSMGATIALGKRFNLIPQNHAMAGRLGKIGLVISAVTITGSGLMDMYHHLLPSEFTMVYGTLTMPEMNEDDDAQHHVRDVLVHVRSKEWSMTNLLVDISLTTVAAAIDTVGSMAGPLSNLAGDSGAEIAGQISTYVDDAGLVIALGDLANALCGIVRGDCAPDLVTVGPFEWRNISLNVFENEGEFIEFGIVESLTGEPSIRVIDPIYYEGIDEGLTVVYVRTDPEAFAGRTMAERINVLVRPIVVSIQSPRYVSEGDMVCVSANMRNALDTSIDWRVLDRNGNEIFRDHTENLDDYFCFDVPDTDPAQVTGFDDFDACIRTERTAYIIVAESATRTGARQYNALEKPRRATASVWVSEEDDICDGLWRFTALREQGDLCTVDPPIMGVSRVLDVSAMLQDMVDAGELDSVMRLDVLDQGERLRFTDPSTGEQVVMSRISERTTTRDIGVHIILDDPPADDGTISALVPMDGGFYEIINAPADSTVWVDGHHYRYQFAFPIAPPLRQLAPMAIDLMFLSPESAVLNHTWHVEAHITVDGTTYHTNCRLDMLYYAEIIESN